MGRRESVRRSSASRRYPARPFGGTWEATSGARSSSTVPAPRRRRAAKALQTASAVAVPTPGASRRQRFRASSSPGFRAKRRWASTSFTWAASKKRTPLRTTKGMPRRASSNWISIEWWCAR